MLLDLAQLTIALLPLPTLTLPKDTPIPTTFTKRAQTALSRPSPLLKTLQVRPSPPESLVQAYLIHIVDKSEPNFRKLLELKGLPRKDQSQLLELFAAHKAAPRHADLPASNPLLAALAISSSGVSGAGGLPSVAGTLGAGLGNATTGLAGAASANLQSLQELQGFTQRRFDPSSLGSALMTAARDGVYGLKESPSVSGAGSRAVSPPPSAGTVGSSGGSGGVGGAGGAGGLATSVGSEAASNVNQNLRNIGKFFRRDLGNFGGRFGKGSGAGAVEEGK